MGVVYQSLDMELQRQVAIKLIHPDLTSSVEAAARFKQEARAAAGFTHPNVVTIYDFDVAADGRAYLVMELLKGVTLRQELKRVHRLTPFRAIEIFTGVCAAVETAHGRKLLHRDLKPENIFLTNSGQSVAAKILDFGVVKTLAQSDEETMEGQTEPGRLVGTPKYMSPEELRGERPKEGWDLWAVAVVAYEMLTGEHPFKGATSSEVRTNILDGKVTPLDRHLPEAPESWQRFFNRALACDAASRPQSAVQLLHDFKQSIQ
jgi:serine/threonine-protein kinase